MNKTFESAEALQIFKAFACVGRIGPDIIMLILRIMELREHLTVMNIGRRHCISTNEAMVDIDTDTVLVAVMVDSILFDPAGI